MESPYNQVRSHLYPLHLDCFRQSCDPRWSDVVAPKVEVLELLAQGQRFREHCHALVTNVIHVKSEIRERWLGRQQTRDGRRSLARDAVKGQRISSGITTEHSPNSLDHEPVVPHVQHHQRGHATLKRLAHGLDALVPHLVALGSEKGKQTVTACMLKSFSSFPLYRFTLSFSSLMEMFLAKASASARAPSSPM